MGPIREELFKGVVRESRLKKMHIQAWFPDIL